MKIASFNFRVLLLLLLHLQISENVRGQVTIGAGTPPQDYSILELVSNGKGGLRYPQLTTEARDALNLTVNPLEAKGLAIFNSTTGCIEYWNNKKWVSLCQGQANIIFQDENGNEIDPTEPAFTHEGETKGPYTLHDNPDCTEENPAYGFIVITGSEYTSINIIDSSTGRLSITMDSNPTARARMAVIRITNNCTKESKEFLFTQNGDDSDCGTTIVPDIKTYGVAELCQDGALYLYLDGYPTTGNFIWTLNGKEMGTGSFLTVTEPGRYVVYGDKIGCANSKSIVITKGSNTAPSPVSFIVVGNNGIACGTGGEVDLVVTDTPAGIIAWYKDGQRTGLTGKSIKATKGSWFATVEDGSCMSQPTEPISITENEDNATIDRPTMMINGKKDSQWTLCRGGSMYLEVENPLPNEKYTWYIDNDEIGTASGFYYPIPAGESFVLRLRATGTGCAAETLSIETIVTSQAPSVPYIITNTDDVLCGGTATLTATNSPSASEYRWFKNGKEIPLKRDASIDVNETGIYTVCAISAGGCSSIQSGPKVIGTSDFATLSWGSSHPTTANVGETKTYSVSMDFPQGATYLWTVDTGADITNGQGTSSITVKFPVAGSFSVKCEAKNACGEALDSPLIENVTVANDCANARITGANNQTSNIKVNGQITLSVTATGTNVSYQWYRGTIGSGTAISNAISSTYTYSADPGAGTYLFYCIATAAGTCTANPATSGQFTVTVTADPATIPTGTGSFLGKTCFDIAQGNEKSGACGAITSRTNQKTIFSNRGEEDMSTGSTAPYTGVQVYTFRPSGIVSRVYFDFVDITGKVIKSVTPKSDYNAMTNISNDCKVVVEFYESLDEDLKELTRQTALKAELYVIYNDNAVGTGTERKIKLTLTLQDCACCGAKTANGGWLNFMCHNLGADENLDPYTSVMGNTDGTGGTFGYLYQWGRPAIVDDEDTGYQARNSPITLTMADNYFGTEPISIKGKFIAGSSSNNYDWRRTTNLRLWGNGTSNENVPKGVNDPCPAGWKIPSRKQWQSIFSSATDGGTPTDAAANTWTWSSQGYGGYKVGDALFLPLAKHRRYYDGKLETGSAGYYWSSTVYNSQAEAYYLFIANNRIRTASYNYYTSGYSVRCVSE